MTSSDESELRKTIPKTLRVGLSSLSDVGRRVPVYYDSIGIVSDEPIPKGPFILVVTD